MSVLNVAEKNDAAKAISNLLSNGNVVKRNGQSIYNKIYEFQYNINGRMNDMIMTSVSGHMMNFEFSPHLNNWQNVDPVILFDSPVNKIYLPNSVPIKKSLEELIRKCIMLIIWTDCDREGENIGMEIVDTCLAENSAIIVKRARFSEITIQSVTRAINNLVDINTRFSQAVDVRQELDLKLGAAFTRLQTLFLQKKFPKELSNQVISYGSCQFPTLGFVVERFKEVENFIIEPFWTIVLTHQKNSHDVLFSWDRVKLFDESLVEAILENITDHGSLACVINITNNPKSKWRPFAMDTIEMEKLSSRKLKINPKTTMQIAEKLYSQGYISYPRTETNIFPNDMNLYNLVEIQTGDNRWGDFARRLLLDGINPHNGRKTDQAHPPIHPLKIGMSLQGDEFRLYELITRHFLACLSKNALGHETKISIDCISRLYIDDNWNTSSNTYQCSGIGESFNLSGLAVLNRNYLEVYPYDKWSDKEIPIYEIGEIFVPSVVIKPGETSPPSLLTEADLISLMDKHGIGTDATHADHIEKVKTRHYVGNTGQNMSFLIPDKLGMGLVEGYDLIGFDLSRPYLRSRFESDLELICKGTKLSHDVLSYYLYEYKIVFQETVRQINKLQEGVAKYLNEIPSTNSSEFNLPTNFPQSIDDVRACLLCEGIIKIKKSNSNNWFLGCNRYPSCKYVLWLPSTIENVEIARHIPDHSIIPCLNTHTGTRNLPVYKLSLKFSIFMGHIDFVFPDENGRFIVCLYCSHEVCETLNIKHQPSKPFSTESFQFINNNTHVKTKLFNEVEIPKSFIHPSVPQLKLSNVSMSQELQYLPSSSLGSKLENKCQCGQIAAVRKVNKDGPNKGKLFNVCALSTCNMFTWIDTDDSTRDIAKPRYSKLMDITDNYNQSFKESEDIVLCKCAKKAKLLTVKKENQNKGRRFYSCAQPKQCDFFQWSDESQCSKKTMIKSRRKTISQPISEIYQVKKSFTSTEDMWPPVMKDFKMTKSNSKFIRSCSRCKLPGHNAKSCSRI